MTMVQHEAGLLPTLVADWRLASFRAGGVTACCPPDMGIHVAIDSQGAVRAQCGPVRAAGRVTVNGQRVVFAEMVVVPPPWGPVHSALEDRVAAALDGEFALTLHQGRLTLHRPAATLEFRQLS